jgi:hypothetical protein
MAEANSNRDRVMAEADRYHEKVMAEAQEEARAAALRECEELKRYVTYEVQAILGEVDAIRAAAQEELEAQRIYAEAANIKALSQDARSRVLRADQSTRGEESASLTDVASLEESGAWESVAEITMPESEDGGASSQGQDIAPSKSSKSKGPK